MPVQNLSGMGNGRERLLARPVPALVAALPGAGAGLTAALAALVLLSGLLPAAFALASGALVGTVPAAVRHGVHSSAGHRLVLALAAVVAVFLLEQVLQPVRQAVATALGVRLNGHLRRRVMEATLTPPGVAHLEDPALLDLVSRAQGVGMGDVNPSQAVSAGASVLAMRLGGVMSAALLWTLYPWLPVVLVAACLAVAYVLSSDLRRNLASLDRETERFRRSTYFRDLALTPPATKELRVFGLGGWVLDRFQTEWTSAMRSVWEARRRHRWVGLGASTALFLVTAGAYGLVARAELIGALTLGRFVVLLGAIQGAFNILNFGSEALNLGYGAAAVPAVRELEQRIREAPSQLRGDGDAAGRPAAEIRFESVRFCYPGRQDDVYEGLDLCIPAGRSLAIVGQNGAGKTTLVKLLARLYDPTAGRILVDGTDLREIDPESWQRRIGAIFQDFVHYQLSAHDNVAVGAPHRAADRPALEAAARRAGALEIVEALPAGWDTILSRQFTDGADVSGGQWQKLALARALFAVDGGAGVLVLDEPTANLDVRAEADIYDRFLELTRGLTTILISHRFSTVRRADRIVVLEGGRVAEEGSHDELMAADGRYAAMFRLQAARFADAADAAGST